MIIFIILGIVVLLACGVIGFLFYMLSKQASDEKTLVTPIVGLGESKVSTEPLQVPVGSAMVVLKEQEEFKDHLHKEYVAKEESYQRKVDELEGELTSISQKAQQQSQEALTTIDELKKENEQLKSESNNKALAVEASLIKAEGTVNALREEQGALQGRLDESQLQVQKLQEEAVFIKQQMTKEIIQVKTQTEQLAVENQNLKNSMDSIKAEIAKEFQIQIDALTQENQTLKSTQQELKSTNQRLKEANEELSKASEAMQWELTKARAQMTSFERACENYQLQLKEALEGAGSSETNSRLQAELEELKKQIEESGKREKLFESELEKSHQQVIALERDYENLKADINNKG